MSFVLTLIGLMLLLDLAVTYWAWKAARHTRWPSAMRWVVGLFMGIQLACLLFIVFGRTVSTRNDQVLPGFLLSSVFLWHFILLPASALLALLEWISRRMGSRSLQTHAPERAGLQLAGEASTASPTDLPNPADVSRTVAAPEPPAVRHVEGAAGSTSLRGRDLPNRRDFLRTAVVAAPPVLTILTTGYALAQQDNFSIRRMIIPLRQLPAELDGLTIAHVTDIHVGRFTEGSVLRKIVETTNQLKADLVLLTGDLINHDLTDLPAAIDAVRNMDSRFGAYMCQGNHDLMRSRAVFDTDVRSGGIPLLVNQSQTVRINSRDVQLLGQRWGWGESSSLSGRGDSWIADSMRILTPQIRPDAFPILLAHHPHAFDDAAAAGIPLTLSGHTHGGQLMVTPRFGFGPMMYKYWSGLYQQGQSKLVVSNGTGNWFPLRINAPAEIVHITLRREA